MLWSRDKKYDVHKQYFISPNITLKYYTKYFAYLGIYNKNTLNLLSNWLNHRCWRNLI